MSNKFVGPIGKELRGNRERATQLIGPTRLMVQRALDKIEARGGKGSQLEQWRTADGCVVWAYVIKETETPIVRVFIECPGGEEKKQFIFATLGYTYDMRAGIRYIREAGFSDEIYEHPYLYYEPGLIWYGYEGARPIVLHTGHTDIPEPYLKGIYYGPEVIAIIPDRTDHIVAVCAAALSGGMYSLCACLDYDTKMQFTIQATPIIHRKKDDPVVIPERKIIFKCSMGFLGIDPDAIFAAQLRFVFSANGTKIAFQAAFGDPPGSPLPKPPRTSTDVRAVYECVLPTEYPETDEEGNVTPVDIVFTQVFDKSELADEITGSITWEPADPLPDSLLDTFKDDENFRNYSSELIMEWDEKVEFCLGIKYEGNTLVIDRVTQVVSGRQSAYHSWWECTGPTCINTYLYDPAYHGEIIEVIKEGWFYTVYSEDEDTGLEFWGATGHRLIFKSYLDGYYINPNGDIRPAFHTEADQSADTVYQGGMWWDTKVRCRKPFGDDYVYRNAFLTRACDHTGPPVTYDIQVHDTQYDISTYNYLLGVDYRIHPGIAVERVMPEPLVYPDMNQGRNITRDYEIYQGKTLLTTVPIGVDTEYYPHPGFKVSQDLDYMYVYVLGPFMTSHLVPDYISRVNYFWTAGMGFPSHQASITMPEVLPHSQFMKGASNYITGVYNVDWPTWISKDFPKVDPPVNAVSGDRDKMGGTLIASGKIMETMSPSIWPAMVPATKGVA